MGADEPRWFYVGEGQLRLKDGQNWTDEYKTIESPRARATETAVLDPDPQTLPGTKPKNSCNRATRATGKRSTKPSTAPSRRYAPVNQ